ncbi:hypothetical protein QK289_15625 [Exiguobacterium antarcticum]|uniref:Uncharacterized protein n=1 Tax=Exiguobacterium antarcticum TaxID=132920 RepID=A0ABT6R666_9BACL|nr:hypothetical protein [Exiguobacterium antarcticum]MDI3236445.1 hypothetical protein [Exiguobacterium antarcticum]
MKCTYTEFCIEQTIKALEKTEGFFTGHDLGLEVSKNISENLELSDLALEMNLWKNEIRNYYEFAEEEFGIEHRPEEDIEGFIRESVAFSSRILFGLSDTARSTWTQPVDSKAIVERLNGDFKKVKKIIFHEI